MDETKGSVNNVLCQLSSLICDVGSTLMSNGENRDLVRPDCLLLKQLTSESDCCGKQCFGGENQEVDLKVCESEAEDVHVVEEKVHVMGGEVPRLMNDSESYCSEDCSVMGIQQVLTSDSILDLVIHDIKSFEVCDSSEIVEALSAAEMRSGGEGFDLVSCESNCVLIVVSHAVGNCLTDLKIDAVIVSGDIEVYCQHLQVNDLFGNQVKMSVPVITAVEGLNQIVCMCHVGTLMKGSSNDSEISYSSVLCGRIVIISLMMRDRRLG